MDSERFSLSRDLNVNYVVSAQNQKVLSLNSFLHCGKSENFQIFWLKEERLSHSRIRRSFRNSPKMQKTGFLIGPCIWTQISTQPNRLIFTYHLGVQASLFFHQKWQERSEVCSTKNQTTGSSNGGADDGTIQFKNIFFFIHRQLGPPEGVCDTNK